ncbi:MAG: hypothetical protein Q4F00_00625, partial [bacterium]|nr:hypothetical protein [bacterium]
KNLSDSSKKIYKYTFKNNEIDSIEEQYKENMKTILYETFNNVEQIESFKQLIKVEKKEKINLNK